MVTRQRRRSEPQELLVRERTDHATPEAPLVDAAREEVARVAPVAVEGHRLDLIPLPWWKRTMDVLGSSLALIALSPLFVLVAVAVRVSSPGPAFFRQRRVGHGGREFTCLKFRSMYVDAEERKALLAHLNEANGHVFKIKDDPRRTPVGKVLRKTSIDELPQFWNVLTGEMSLVGPRPPLPFEVEQYQPWHRRRVLDAMPGVTGLWQVKGRSRTTFDEMVRLDLRYARRPSIWNDIKILAATPRAVVTGKGAR